MKAMNRQQLEQRLERLKNEFKIAAHKAYLRDDFDKPAAARYINRVNSLELEIRVLQANLAEESSNA